MHTNPADNETGYCITPLSALEISGAVSARVIHDLSNLISGIVGNAEYADHAANGNADLKKALQGILASANTAGKLLGQCLPLQRSLSSEAIAHDLSEVIDLICEAAGLAPGWRASLPSGLGGQVKVQPRWLAAAIWQIARETQAPSGEVQFACGPAVFPVIWRGASSNLGRPAQLFQVILQYRSDETLFPGEGLVSLDRPSLLAAQELIRRVKGQIHARSKPPGRQEISVLIPLA